jgi:hypothetical protein
MNVKSKTVTLLRSGRVTKEGLYMKKHSFFRLLGLFALIVAIGFSTTACPHETPAPRNTTPGNTNPGDIDPGNTDQGNTDQGNTDQGNTDQGNTDPGDIDQGNTDPGDTDQGNTDPDDTDEGNTDPVVPEVNLFEGTWKGYNNSTTMEYTLTFVSDETWTISPALGGGNGNTGTYTYDDKVATLLSADGTEIGTLTIGADGKITGDLKGVSGSTIANAGKLGGGILGGLVKE